LIKHRAVRKALQTTLLLFWNCNETNCAPVIIA
jgi:hypothetical protein